MSPAERETLKKSPSQLDSPAAVRFHRERSPSPGRPHFPLVAHGIASRFSTATLSEEVATYFFWGDLGISIVTICIGFVIRGAFSTDSAYFCWRPRLSELRSAHLAACSVVDGGRDSAGWVS